MTKYTAKDIKIRRAGSSYEELIDISLDGFARNLNNSACLARDFTRKFIVENLPDEMVYLVCLGESYDRNPLKDEEVTFPEDYENRQRNCANQEEVVKLLWRNGMVPEWINVEVSKQSEKYTQIQLTCCGRFSSKKAHIYHRYEGNAPFHVLGPSLPIGYKKGTKFSLYWRQNA